jgi:hypothetical protein
MPDARAREQAVEAAPRRPTRTTPAQGAETTGPALSPHLTLGDVLALQRAAGNRAVEGLIATRGRAPADRERPPVQRAVAFAPAIALTDKDLEALADQVHTAIEGWGTDEEGVYSAFQKLGKAQPTINKLKKKYKDKYKADLEADVRGDFSGKELQLALELINIKADAKQAALVGQKPATDPEFKAAAKALYAAMKGMGTKIEALYGVLMPFNRDKPALDRLKAVYQTELLGGLTGKGLEADIKDEWGLSKNEESYALYLLNAPPPGAPHAGPALTAAGAEAVKGKVPGGELSARTGASMGAPYDQMYSLGYKGGLAAESHWLQFIWREVVVTDARGKDSRLADSITTTGGTYNLTTDPDAPNYNTDSASATSPFYEAGGLHGRTADSITMYDMPAPATAFVTREFAGGAKRVVSRAHFNTFLVRDYKVLQHVKVEVEWTFVNAAAPPRVQSARSEGNAESLPDDIKLRLVAQYPLFAYIK